MDKLAGDLLRPFVLHLTAVMPSAALLFWGFGLLLVHVIHPGAMPGCPTGGTDLCGLLSDQWPTAAKAGGVLAIAVIAISVLVFSRGADTVQFLSGSMWIWRQFPVRMQRNTRNKFVRRGYSLSFATTTIDVRARARVRRYPHGTPTHVVPCISISPLVGLEPTRLGNVFAAERQRLLARTGLRLGSCWWTLMVVIQDGDRQRLASSSAALLVRAQAVSWAMLSALWAAFFPDLRMATGWVLGCVVTAYWLYRELCVAAGSYCDELHAVVLTNRHRLYGLVGFPLPVSTSDEPAKGIQLSGFLDQLGTGMDVPLQWRPEDGKSPGA